MIRALKPKCGMLAFILCPIALEVSSLVRSTPHLRSLLLELVVLSIRLDKSRLSHTASDIEATACELWSPIAGKPPSAKRNGTVDHTQAAGLRAWILDPGIQEDRQARLRLVHQCVQISLCSSILCFLVTFR